MICVGGELGEKEKEGPGGLATGRLALRAADDHAAQQHAPVRRPDDGHHPGVASGRQHAPGRGVRHDVRGDRGAGPPSCRSQRGAKSGRGRQRRKLIKARV